MFYLINKPIGITSFDAIRKFAQANNIKKIGHSGTLDPIASGALLVATDEDTKLLDYVSDRTKTYVATFKVGYVSNTLDSTGSVKKISDQKINIAIIKKTLTQFLGKRMQTPPQFSAKKIDGQRSYSLARKGIQVNLKPVAIEIFKISDLKQVQANVFSFKVVVSAGTYIRSLISDIGAKLKIGAIMTALNRIQIGNQKLSTKPRIINPLEIIDLPVIKLTNLDKIKNGQQIKIKNKDGLYLLFFNNQIIGIGKVSNQILKPKKIFGKRIS